MAPMHKQRKQSMTSPLGLPKTKQQEFPFVSLFVLLLAYVWTMILCLYAYAYDDPYVAGLTSFLCFAFCFAVMLMLTCEPGFTPDKSRWPKAPRDLTGVNPPFEVFNRLKT